MVLLTKPESEFDCEIQDLLRSTFLISSGSTSTWSVVVTSQPNKAIPNPARPQPAPNSITLFPFILDGQNRPFLLFFSKNLINTIDASQTVVPRCLEFGSCEISSRWPITSSEIADVLGEFNLSWSMASEELRHRSYGGRRR